MKMLGTAGISIPTPNNDKGDRKDIKKKGNNKYERMGCRDAAIQKQKCDINTGENVIEIFKQGLQKN